MHKWGALVPPTVTYYVGHAYLLACELSIKVLTYCHIEFLTRRLFYLFDRALIGFARVDSLHECC